MKPEDLITKHFRINPNQQKGLAKLQLQTLADLLFYLPSRYANQGDYTPIAEIKEGQTVTIYAKVTKSKTGKAYRKKIPLTEAILEDNSGKIEAVWFHQAYIAHKIPAGTWAEFSGKATIRKDKLYLANPIINTGEENKTGNLFNLKNQDAPIIPVYKETRYISSGWLYYHLEKIIANKVHEQIIDPIPDNILNKYQLPSLSTALVWIHKPKKEKDALAARKRFAFQEIFFIQLDRISKKQKYQNNLSFNIKIQKNDINDFIKRLPFPLTKAQEKAINTINEDFKKNKPMTRLLEGDVGSGKTAVATCTAFACVKAGYEVAYMAPTEILARQHFESFIEYFSHLNIQIGLLTGSECLKFPSKINPEEPTHISRSQLLKWVASGDIPIVIGTHALIQKTVKFKKLAYTIVDEQHRFGIMQRAKLLKQGGGHIEVPHLLSMTATPIPRTLALTIYGDLDLSLLDQLPTGRKQVKTHIIKPDQRSEVYQAVKEQLLAGHQAYVICPRIDDPDPNKASTLNAKSAKSEALRLKKNIFPEYSIGLLHSKLKPKDKEKVMTDFKNHQIDILVATSVVEVGVNVPNATIILIEGSERFGLAQLHQLRGRVMRSHHQPYCYLITETTNEKSLDRLNKLIQAKNGFELAEADLALRGAGTLSGSKQWGLSDLAMEAIKNIKMVEASRFEAENLIEKDPELKNYPRLREYIEKNNHEVHFE